jgi:hypothetical protein
VFANHELIGPVQDSPYLSSIEGTMEHEIYTVLECLPLVLCLCCYGERYGISIRRAAPQCIQHRDRIGCPIEINKNTFVFGLTQFFNNSVIPGSSAHFDAKFPAQCGEGGDQKRIGRYQKRLNCTRFHFILHSTALQGNQRWGGNFLARPERAKAVLQLL